jgi:hypothetical protein
MREAGPLLKDCSGYPKRRCQLLTAEGYQQADRELALREARHGFKIHAAIYTLVILGLVTLNVLLVLLTDAAFFWFPFPLVGWGIGLTMHYLFGVRGAEREIAARHRNVEQYAKEVRKAA